MKIYKKISFWLAFLAVGVCLLNLFGYDDKSLLLFFISPPFWVMGNHWFVEHFAHPASISMEVKYLATIVFWLLFGLSLDALFLKRKKS